MEQREKETYFSRKGEIKKALFISSLVLILIVRETKPTEKFSLLSQIEQLLEEFVDVFPKQLPLN